MTVFVKGKRKKSRSEHFCYSSPTPDLEPSSYISPQAPCGGRRGGGIVLKAPACCVSPLRQLRNKTTFLFPPNSVLYFLFSFTEQKKPRNWPATIFLWKGFFLGSWQEQNWPEVRNDCPGGSPVEKGKEGTCKLWRVFRIFSLFELSQCREERVVWDQWRWAQKAWLQCQWRQEGPHFQSQVNCHSVPRASTVHKKN